MGVLFAQVTQHNRFYKNPFRLQCLSHQLKDLGIDNSIFDIDANYCYSDISADIIVIDTTETELIDVVDKFKHSHINNIVLFGDSVHYGLKNKAIDYLRHYFRNCNILVFNEKEVIDFFIRNRSLIDTHNDSNINEDAIFHTYKEFGLQYFVRGVADGCEMCCSFCKFSCSNEKRINLHHRDGIDDIKAICDYCKEEVFIQFSDENFFGCTKNRLEYVFQLAEYLCHLHKPVFLGVDTRIDTICSLMKDDNPMQKKCWNSMIDAGLRYCFVGIESFVETQSRRYHKQLDLSFVDKCISFFQQENIVYTFGLILWDPLMSITELEKNLEVIQKKGLLGKTASLWKPLRIPINSSYWKQYGSIISNYRNIRPSLLDSDCFLYEENLNLFLDDRIREIAKIVVPLYHIFDSSGYRHSDVSCFEVFYTDKTPTILKTVPKIVSQLEINILCELLSLQSEELLIKSTLDYIPQCKRTVMELLRQLKGILSVSFNERKVLNYYIKVLGLVETNLESYTEEK